MKRILAIVALCASVACAAPNVFLPNPKTVTWTLSGGQYWAKYASGAVDDGSVLWWEFLNTNNPCDDSSFVGTNVGTLGASSAKPTWIAATGGVSACYSFDGGDYISAVACPDLALAGTAFTMRVWFKSNGTLASQTDNSSIMHKGLVSDTDSRFAMYVPSGEVLGLFFTDTSENYVVLNTPTLTGMNGIWHELVGEFNGAADTMSFYIDTVLVTNKTGVTQTFKTSNKTFWLGASAHDSFFVNGSCDEATILKGPLSASRRQTDFWLSATNHGWTAWQYANRSGLASSTVCKAAYNFNVSGVAEDTSGNGNHGTIHGATWQAQGGTYPNGWLTCDGVNDYITIATDPFFAKTNATFSMWFFLTANPTTDQFDCYASKFNTANVWFGLYASSSAYSGEDDLLLFWYSSSTNRAYAYTTTDLVTTGVWHHVTIAYDGQQTGNANRLKLYHNGKQETLTFAGENVGAFCPYWTGLWIGADNAASGREIPCRFDDIRVWSGNSSAATLTSNQVYNLWNNTKGPFQ